MSVLLEPFIRSTHLSRGTKRSTFLDSECDAFDPSELPLTLRGSTFKLESSSSKQHSLATCNYCLIRLYDTCEQTSSRLMRIFAFISCCFFFLVQDEGVVMSVTDFLFILIIFIFIFL